MSYQSRGWADSATAPDVENIREVLKHEDMGTRRLAIGSLKSLAEASQRDAIDLAKNIEFEDSAVLVSELCQLFYGGWGLSFSELTADDLQILLCKLEDVQDIDDSYIDTFLVKTPELDAATVVGFLLNRVRKTDNERPGYNALPLLGFDDRLIGLSNTPDHEDVLREIRDALLEPGSSIKYWIPQLFREVSSDFESAAGLKILDEWINSGSADRIETAAHLISHAQSAFVFEHVEFVSDLLERAHAASSDSYRRVTSSLASSVLSGTRSGTPGQPMPAVVAMKDQASARARQLDTGSPTHKFYAFIAKSAEASITDQLMRDEELFE